ncbi:MAG: hypothetical protein MZV70_37715 [Desulfobacterales bacterium]|nr:hypothetical protein [Desulfobacterales bacterium]
MEVAFLANYIPEDKLSEIRHAVDIVEVVSESVASEEEPGKISSGCVRSMPKKPLRSP